MQCPVCKADNQDYVTKCNYCQSILHKSSDANSLTNSGIIIKEPIFRYKLNKAAIKNQFDYHFIKYLPLTLKVQLVDSHVLRGQTGYTKFIILGRKRTGSNLVLTSFILHKNILCYGEIFNRINPRSWGFLPKGFQRPGDCNLLNEKPVEFLSNRIFRKYPNSVKAVGFKIFYFHTTFHEEQTESVWQYLKENSHVKIIHLKRRNRLKAHLSEKIALKTGEWVNIFDTNSANIKLSLDYDECLKDFEYTLKMENEFDSLFTEHKKIDVFYEDLHQNFSEEMKKIQIFLGLTPYPLKPQIFKQTLNEPQEIITNFDELRNKFSSTKWKCFFEE